MPKAQRKNNMGKAQNNPTPNSTEHVEDPYNGISVEIAQDTDCKLTITDIFKEIIELGTENEKLRKDLERDNDKRWKELWGEIEILKKDLEGENHKLWKEVETLKRSQAKMKKENDQ